MQCDGLDFGRGMAGQSVCPAQGARFIKPPIAPLQDPQTPAQAEVHGQNLHHLMLNSGLWIPAYAGIVGTWRLYPLRPYSQRTLGIRLAEAPSGQNWASTLILDASLHGPDRAIHLLLLRWVMDPLVKPEDDANRESNL